MALSGARVYRNTTQSISTSTLTTLSFTTARRQDGATYWSAGAPTRLTIPSTGVYTVGHVFEIANITNNLRTVYADILLNGTTIITEHSGSGMGRTGNSADTSLLAASVTRPFTAGDYLEVRVYQNCGSSLNTTAGDATNEHLNDFWIQRQDVTVGTGSILLPIRAATIPDGTTNNAAPALQVAKGTNTAPARFTTLAAFDASTREHLWWTFTVPDDYASGGTLRLLWAANAVTGVVVWGASIGAVTAADADTYLEHEQATASTANGTVNTTEARRVTETTISPAVDSMAPDDLVTVLVYRDAANGSDTCSVDAELLSVVFEYTTA